MSKRSLEELLAGYQQGSIEAFNEFFQRTKGFVFNYLRSRLSSSADAEDVFQETYFRVHRYVHAFDSGGRAIVWLAGIARNATIDRLRAPKTVNLSEDMQRSLAGRETADERTKLRVLLEELLVDLDRDEAALVIDRIFHEENYENLAAKHGLTVVSARKKVSRILQKFRKSWVR